MQVDPQPSRPLSLSEEHGLLLRQVAARAEELLAVTCGGSWPGRELDDLLAYLREEVLRQAYDEERLLFPSYASSPALERLGRDHTVLHLLTDTLSAAASGRGPQVPAELGATIEDLLAHLERHLSDEEALLAGDDHGEPAGWRGPGLV